MADIGIGKLAELTASRFQPSDSMSRMVSFPRPIVPQAASGVTTPRRYNGYSFSAMPATLALS
jgi:hypothetical protein